MNQSEKNVGYGQSFKNEGTWRASTPRGINSSHFSGKGAGSVDYNRFYSGHNNFLGFGPKNYRRSDESIREDVCNILFKNQYIDASDIEVNVEHGVVFLSGEVNLRSAKIAAERVLDDVFGVEDIQNCLTIKKWGDYPRSEFTKKE